MLLTAEIYRTAGGLHFEEKKKFFFLSPPASAADPGLEWHEDYRGRYSAAARRWLPRVQTHLPSTASRGVQDRKGWLFASPSAVRVID